MDTSSSGVESQTFFTTDHAPAFGEYSLADEELHLDHAASNPHYSLTETQYMGFSVPEHALRCYVWTWCHPNLGVVTSAVMAWQGVQQHMLGAPLFDFRNHMSADVFADGFTNYKLDNGFQLEMTDPGRQFRLRYRDDARGNSFDVTQTAVSEPLVWPTNNHFEQVLHCTGEITLRGERFEVDSYTVRDRSFGEYRSEAPVDAPPASWLTAIFDDVTICVVVTDDPALDPVWKDQYDMDQKSLIRFGWVLADGRKIAVEEAHAHTVLDPDSLFPTAVTMDVIDVEGGRYRLTGDVTAAAPLSTMINQRLVTGLMSWTYDGRRGYGEIQHWQFTDFVVANSPSSPARQRLSGPRSPSHDPL